MRSGPYARPRSRRTPTVTSWAPGLVARVGRRLPALLLVPALLALPAPGSAHPDQGPATPATAAVPTSAPWVVGGPRAVCSPDPGPPDYYRIPLVTTGNVPRTAYARGRADVTFAPSPFVVAVGTDGSYAYDVHVAIPELPEPRGGVFVAWVTTTEVDRIQRLGVLEDGRVEGRVAWNKFLVVVTLEAEYAAPSERWSGPIAFRGMSRSGKMHTMAGHGPFEQENCAAYGYD